jgi:aspartate/tyrosine/aromatic aminotransferase
VTFGWDAPEVDDKRIATIQTISSTGAIMMILNFL